MTWDASEERDVMHVRCFCHYQGNPRWWLELISAPAVGWRSAGSELCTQAEPHVHACGLNNTMGFFGGFFFFLQRRGGKTVKAEAPMTLQGGASNGAFRSAQPMADHIWGRQQLTWREWIPEKTHDPAGWACTDWIHPTAASFLFSWSCKWKVTSSGWMRLVSGLGVQGASD